MNKCMSCGKVLTVSDKYDDICNECWDYANYIIEEDYEEVECGVCGELHPKEHIREGMCGYCFSINVGE